MAQEAQTTAMDKVLYSLSIRLKGLSRGLGGFLQELRRHPTAMLGGVLTLVYILSAIFAAQMSPHDPLKGDLRLRLLPPAWEEGGDMAHPLGTDQQGRDLLSRIIYGSRISLGVGFFVVSISAVVGITLGSIAGYYRGRADNILSGLVNLLLAFPFLVFAVAVMAFLGPGFANMLIALTFKDWVTYFRLVRGEMFAEKTKEYVDAAKVADQSAFAIIVSEILPNIFHSVMILMTLRMGTLILTEAALSYLGLGVRPPTPSWGNMLMNAQQYMAMAPWLALIPGFFIFVTLLGVNFLGDGLRDALDPRMKV